MIETKEFLYHASAYNHTELHPGFYHSNKLVEWDKTESNKFLYVSTNKNSSIDQGFASAIEKKFNLLRFSSNKKDITMYFEGKLPTKQELMKIVIYLYKIEWVRANWDKVDNRYNNSDDEYKTRIMVENEYILSTITIPMSTWMKTRNITIKGNKNVSNTNDIDIKRKKS